LPPTNSVFGRPGKPRSHRLYVVEPALSTVKFQDPLRPKKTAMLVEVRSGGCHTVFPPSIHESGEEIAWDRDADPLAIGGEVLLACVRRLAAAALLARYWPPSGARHDCALALAGTLLSRDWTIDETTRFVGAIARAAGDGEAGDRVAAVATTDARLRGGQPATGLPTLKTFLDERVVARARDWLHLDHADRKAISAQDEPRAAPHRPYISISSRHMHEITNDALAALERANDPPSFYNRGGPLVRLRHEDGRTWSEVLHPDALRGELDRAAWFVKKEGVFLTPARPPADVVRDILALAQLPFPKLQGISHTPVLTENGMLVETGYDPASGLYLSLTGLEGLRTDLPLDRARHLLLVEMLGDFPFVDASDWAHALAMVLLPFVRPAVAGPTPIGLISAPDRGTGKGLFAECVSRLALGRAAEVMADTGDEAETRKRITALLLEGHSIIQLDNLTELRSTKLAAAITAESWMDRVLGSTKIVHMPQRAVWIATANNPAISNELVRRIIEARLDAGVERPEERTGWRHPDLLGRVSDNRSLLVSACLSLVQGWVNAGRPAGHTAHPLGRFEKWTAIMGGILEVARVPGFLDGRHRLHAQADAETQEWLAFVHIWHEGYGGAPVVAKDLLALAVTHDLLIDLRAGRGQLGAQQRLGHALGQRVDRVFGQWRVRKAGEGSTGNNAYRLESMARKTPETPKTPPATHEQPAPAGGVFVDGNARTPPLDPKTPPENGHLPGVEPGVSGVFGVSGRSVENADREDETGAQTRLL
jgi:hypothetical protein